MRPKEDVDAGHCRAEADAIQEAIDNRIEKGPWVDLFVSGLASSAALITHDSCSVEQI